MTGPIFVDTNVLVYAKDRKDPVKRLRATEWLDMLWDTGSGRVSFQVLNELYATVTKVGGLGLPPDGARAFVRAYLAWHPITEDAALLEQGWAIQDRYRFSWWDSLIVAAAHVAGCRYLLTEDLQHEQRLLGGLVVLNPFELAPSRLAEIQG